MSLEKRIYKNIAIIAIIVSVFTSILITLNFYGFFVDREKEYLKGQASMLAETLKDGNIEEMDEYLKRESDSFRVTLIEKDGNVRYDSVSRVDAMDNHLNRPEISMSINENKAEAVRYSETLSKDTYYFACLMQDGSILRVSRTMDNVLLVFLKVMPMNLGIILLILIILLFFTKKFSNRIIKPIYEISFNIEDIVAGKSKKPDSIYDELVPFVEKIDKQSEEISKIIQKLKEDAAIMHNITSNMSEGIVLIGADKIIIEYNNSAINQFYGDINIDYRGQNILNLYRNIQVNDAIDKSIKNLSGFNIIVKEKNTIKNIYINPVINNNKIIGVVLFIIDVTEQKKAEKMRRDFSANVSHELKSPLTSINGYAEMIAEGFVKDEEDIKHFASIINKEGKRLLELINSIIRLSQLEERKGEDDFELVNLLEILEDSKERFKLLAKDREIELNVQGDDLSVIGNKVMLEELVSNIIENGIKHSKAENLYMNLYDTDNTNYLSIRDNGIGISKENQERIFERFYIVDESRTKENNSTGLGLSIVKHIVEYHKANIKINSEINKGTEIIISFPKK